MVVIAGMLAAPLAATFRRVSRAQARRMTGQCHVLGSLSSVVYAFLCYLLFARLMHDHVIPWAFATRLRALKDDAMRAAWGEKITALTLPILVRVLCAVLLLPGWAHFSFRRGLDFRTTTWDGRCDVDSSGVAAARAFYTARYMLAALMLYELAATRAPHWSIVLHHVLTVVACTATTDAVLLETIGGDVSSGISNGVGFVTFFYDGLTAFEMALVLTYHLCAGQQPRQAAAMGAAAALQCLVTTCFFVMLPAILLANAVGDASAAIVVLLALVCVGMYVIELFIASVRVNIARKKWREHREAMVPKRPPDGAP
jgi:hypothetical protein